MVVVFVSGRLWAGERTGEVASIFLAPMGWGGLSVYFA